MAGYCEVCFVLNSQEYRVDAVKLQKTSEYYQEILKPSKDFMKSAGFNEKILDGGRKDGKQSTASIFYKTPSL